MSLDLLERILWWTAGLCWLVLALILWGEVKGWWNDAGEVGGMIATTLGVLLTLIALLVNATKVQARAVRMGVTDNGRRLGMIHDGVEAVDAGVQEIHGGIQRLHQDNEQIHGGIQRLHQDNEQIHGGIQRLHQDNEQIHEGIEGLHEQTERQTGVLVEIRDRL